MRTNEVRTLANPETQGKIGVDLNSSYIRDGDETRQTDLIAELQQRTKDLEAEVEQRKQVEAELRRDRDQMVENLDSSPVCIHSVGADGTILWANRAELQMLGYSSDEYVGHHISEFHVDQQAIRDLLQQMSRDEKLRNFRAVLVCRDGSPRTVAIDSKVLRDEDGHVLHTQCFTRDITDEKNVEETSRLLGAMVESCDDAVISKNLNGVITSWNAGAERVFGYTAAEAIGKPVMMLIPDNRHNEEPEVLRKIRSGQRIDHYETVRKRKNGDLIDISLTVSPVFDTSGRIIGASKVARDITDAKRDQIRLIELTQELSKSRHELEQRVEERTVSLKEALAQMEEFSYTVSHDLRAPLRAMHMYSKVLMEDWGDLFEPYPEAQNYLQRISNNCLRLDQMIMDVLTFGRVARGPLELKPVSLDKVVEQTIENVASLKPPLCQVEVAELGDVLANETSLFQAVSNILINAAKFVPVGIKPKIKIWAVNSGLSIRLWIEDNGIGIEPQLHHRLFEMFERVHPELDYEGTGVGLAIVRKAIMRMGGHVGVESDGKNGSRFWIELPAAERF